MEDNQLQRLPDQDYAFISVYLLTQKAVLTEEATIGNGRYLASQSLAQRCRETSLSAVLSKSMLSHKWMGWQRVYFIFPNMDMNILLLMLPLTGGNELNFLKFLSAADLDWCAISIPIPVFFSMINQDQMRVLLDLMIELM
ncbi:hypothetical protein MTR_3g088800 [Medicago truncatula]|uniref:Uncharacterized protein n=1 Tax=Medicago truncatula TaxID=3880 RepID=A0A072V0S2_MEDTR|nr:hypothetical protein MTR_3g088800 [Medicago truncatula]